MRASIPPVRTSTLDPEVDFVVAAVREPVAGCDVRVLSACAMLGGSRARSKSIATIRYEEVRSRLDAKDRVGLKSTQVGRHVEVMCVVIVLMVPRKSV